MKTSTVLLLVLPMGGLAVPVMKYPRNPGAWDNFKATFSKIPAAFGEVPNAVAGSAKSVVSKENGNALRKSGGDLVKGLKDAPNAVSSSGKTAFSKENGNAFGKSAGDLVQGAKGVPKALADGRKKAFSKENGNAFGKSAGDLVQGAKGVPKALASGAGDLKKSGNDIANAFQKAPGQLAQAAREFNSQFDKGLPPGSNGRKLFDGATGSIPALKAAQATSNLGKIKNTALDGGSAAYTIGKQVMKNGT